MYQDQFILLIVFMFFSKPGLIGDTYGTYKPAFYVGGGISIIAGCMMFLLFCFKQNSEAVHLPQDMSPEHITGNLSNPSDDAYEEENTKL